MTVLGGEPFEPKNQPELTALLQRVKARYPHKTVWCFTGFRLDDELLLRARAAREPARGIRLLEAMETPTPEALLLLGNLRMARKDYPGAIDALLAAEPARPLEAAKLLEVCYRELEDYRSAYHWACKQR